MIRPRLEDWLLRRAQASKVNPEEYGLPNDAMKLHSIQRYDERPEFSDFLVKLHRCDSEVKKMAEWLSGRP